MRQVFRRVVNFWRAETWLLTAVLVFAGLLLGFAWLAGEVMEGLKIPALREQIETNFFKALARDVALKS